MDLSEKLSALILASEVVKNVGIHTDHDTREQMSKKLMQKLSGVLDEMDGTYQDKPKRARRSEQSKTTVATSSDDKTPDEKEHQVQQAVKAAAEPEPKPEPKPEPVVESEVQNNALDYDRDVAPAVRSAAAADRGRAVDLLKAYGVKVARDVPEEEWGTLIKQMKEIAGA